MSVYFFKNIRVALYQVILLLALTIELLTMCFNANVLSSFLGSVYKDLGLIYKSLGFGLTLTYTSIYYH